MSEPRQEPLDGARILIVDDEPANVLLLERILGRAGYTETRSTTDSRRAMALFGEHRPDLVLLDLHMPHVDGFALLEEISAAVPEGAYLPVLVLTADVTRSTRERVLSSGARDFLTKPFDSTEVLLRTRNLLQTRSLHLRLEEQLRHAQKMEMVGRLTGGIAHDFNNMLTAIRVNAQLLLMDVPAADPMRDDLLEIDGAVGRAASLTRQLLAFSRKGTAERRVLDPNALVRGLEKTLLRLIGPEVELRTLLELEPGRVVADPGQMEQVLMNLVVNARDATPAGGTITIATRRVEGEEEESLPAGAYVRLAVADTGCGMDEATQARIFEPFYTTKEEGRGTGLGLSIVRRIVDQSGGILRVESRVGAGSTFSVYLPWVEEAAGRAGEPVPAAAGPGGTETVLVVEPEEAVRSVVRKALLRPGYRVLEARGGGEALRFSEEYTGPIHVLVTDLGLPEVNGVELAARLRLQRPSMRVLFISGNAEHPLAGTPPRDAHTALLEKPFASEALTRRVREMLDAPAAG